MRHAFLFPAVAALMAAGCVEIDSKKAGDRPPPADVLKPAAPPPVEREPTPDDDADPLLRATELSAKRVADLEERIDTALTELGDDIRSLSAGDRRAADLTAQKLLAVVQLLRQSGERIAERHPKVKADLDAIVRAGPQLKVAYAHAKATYLEKAESVGGVVGDNYSALAELCDAHIRGNEDRTRKYAEFNGDLSKAVAKVRVHVQFLKDFEAFLKLNPATQGAKNREEFMESLNRFAEHVLQFGDVLKLFRDRVRDGALSGKLRDEHEKTVAASVPAARMPGTDSIRETAASSVALAHKDETPAHRTTPTAVVAAQIAPPPATGCRSSAGQFMPVQVTRCVATLVPVTCYHSQPGPFGRCHTVVATRYEWRNQLVTETRLVAVRP